MAEEIDGDLVRKSKNNDTSSSSEEEEVIQPGVNAGAVEHEFEIFLQVQEEWQLSERGLPVCQCTDPPVEPRLVVCGLRNTCSLGRGGRYQHQDNQMTAGIENTAQADDEEKLLLYFIITLLLLILLNLSCFIYSH